MTGPTALPAAADDHRRSAFPLLEPALQPRLSWGDPVMRPVVERVAQAAGSSLPVVITGELGTGKKLVARTIRATGILSSAPLTIINCRRPYTSRFESELLEAVRIQPADRGKGTVLLDGLDALDSRLQSRLVPALDEIFDRKQADRQRLLATSRKDPARMSRDGLLRREIFLHLAVLSVRLPPLRARKLDLPSIAESLLSTSTPPSDLPPDISTEAMLTLLSAPWPGNIRELRNCLTRASLLAEGGPILPKHLRLDALSIPEVKTLSEIERQAIVEALETVGGNRRKAAGKLGIGLRTLYDKIKRYSIDL